MGPEVASTAVVTKLLRVFLLDGHVGPMNDMVSLLVNVLGVSPASIDGMYFLQAHIMHSMLDKRILLRKPRGLLGKSVHYRELNRFLTLDPKAGAGPSAYLCDKRRCRQAVHDEGIRREFAARFGALGKTVVLRHLPSDLADLLRSDAGSYLLIESDKSTDPVYSSAIHGVGKVDLKHAYF